MNIQRMNNGGVRIQVTNNIPSFLDIFRRNKIKTLTEIGKFCTGKMDYYAAVDTGFMKSRNDYRITMDKNLKLINDCHYAGYQEFGTYKMNAQPFMRPSVYGHLTEIEMIAGRNMSLDL
jgi:HK97 gp10 family phage protein